MLHNSKQNINLAPLNFGPTTGEYYTFDATHSFNYSDFKEKGVTQSTIVNINPLN